MGSKVQTTKQVQTLPIGPAGLPQCRQCLTIHCEKILCQCHLAHGPKSIKDPNYLATKTPTWVRPRLARLGIDIGPPKPGLCFLQVQAWMIPKLASLSPSSYFESQSNSSADLSLQRFLFLKNLKKKKKIIACVQLTARRKKKKKIVACVQRIAVGKAWSIGSSYLNWGSSWG